MTGLPFEVYVRHRGVRLPYPLHRWHAPEEREGYSPPEEFRPSEFDPVGLILMRVAPEGAITLKIEGSECGVTLEEGKSYREVAAWAPPHDEDALSPEALWGRAGLYRLRVSHGDRAWVTTLEVQPHYLSFDQMGRMCADIERLSTWVAWDVLPYAPVVANRLPRFERAGTLDDDPSLEFVLLKEAIPEALRALRDLTASPRHQLKPTYRPTRAGVTSRQDRSSLRLEDRLNAREEGWAVQRVGELNYDTYENRFVKRLLRDLERRLGQLQSRFMDALYELECQEDEVRRRLRRQFGDQRHKIQREEPIWTRPLRNRRAGMRERITACGRMKDSLAQVLQNDLFREVRSLQGIVRPTNVLQHDPRYSRLWAIYRLLNLSNRTEPSLAERFHRRSRPSWELYEMWTAVQVMEACMRDLRFTRMVDQTVAHGHETGTTHLYDTPRPAILRLAHETDLIEAEIIYGGFIPMSRRASILQRAHAPTPAQLRLIGDWPAAPPPAESVSDSQPGLAHPEAPPNAFPDGGAALESALEEAAPMGSPAGAPKTGAGKNLSPRAPVDDLGLPPADLPPWFAPNGVAMEEPLPPPEAPSPPSGESAPEPYYEDFLRGDSSRQDDRLLTRGVQTAPDIQVRFIVPSTGEILGVVVLDAKYKGAKRLWGENPQKPTKDRMALESYLLDVHRREHEDLAVERYAEPADDVVLGAYALFPGERYGRELRLEQRHCHDGRMGALLMTPDDDPTRELTEILMEAYQQVQLRYCHRRIEEDEEFPPEEE